jgi:serine/threonine protein kinase
MENYEKIKRIGRGTFGSVVLVQRILDKSLFAMKRVPIDMEAS